MKEFLTEQLERTNYWLAFAEAKNVGLVALNRDTNHTESIAMLFVSGCNNGIISIICLKLKRKNW